MTIGGIFWSRLVGSILGVVAALAIFRMLENRWGLAIGLAAFLGLSWWGEQRWWRQASAEERRLALEDRVRNPPE